MAQNDNNRNELETLREELAQAQSRAIRLERFFAQAQSQLEQLYNLVGTNDPELIAKEINENRESNKNKSDFWDMISHELRTPMSGVLGMVDLLGETALSEEQRDYLHSIRNSGERLLELLNSIFDFSMLESKSLRIYPMPFELREIIENSLEAIAPQAFAHGIDIVLDYSPLAPEMAIGDPGRIRQILDHILENSVKHTTKGYIKLQVKIEPLDDGSSRLCISIIDTGKGISEEVLANLFRRVNAIGNNTTNRFSRFGLSLLICERLLHLMGGTMGATSNPNAAPGEPVTNVFFNLPLALLYNPDYEPPKHPKVDGQKILLAGITQPRRKSLEIHIKSLGGKVQSVDTAEECSVCVAAKAGMEQPYDVVIIDRDIAVDGYATELLSLAEFAPPKLILLDKPLMPNEQDVLPSDFEQYIDVLRKPIHSKLLLEMLINTKEEWEKEKAQKSEQFIAQSREQRFSPTRLFSSASSMTARGRVLILDNIEADRQNIKLILERFGFSTHVAATTTEAEHMLETVRYHFLLVSCHMEKQDQGFEFAKQIRADSRFESMSIIGMSPFAHDGDSTKAIKYGMTDCLQKPIKAADLSEMLTHLRR